MIVRSWVLALLVLLLVMGCGPATVSIQPPTSASGPTPPTPEEPTVDTAAQVVSFRLSEASTSRVRAEVEAGTSAQMQVISEPTLYEVGPGYTSMRPWKDHSVTEMRICAALDGPCPLEDEWILFAPVQTYELPIDWVGPRDFWVTVQYRDAAGDIVPVVGPSNEEPQSSAEASYNLTGVVDEAASVEDQPPGVQTDVAATRTAFPVQGSVEIANGKCCAGGTAGDTIQVPVAFEATSPFADVVEMRVRSGGRCFSEDDMAGHKWEPYVSEKEFPVHVALNWIGFWVSVQYRDSQGNLSPVYCDDISVEGHPGSMP